jgi:deoxyhypusine synthase
VDECFFAYNSTRLQKACHLFRDKILKDNVLVGFGIAGALTPSGLGTAAIIPLIERGCIDYIVSTGANLYHDLHFAFNQKLWVPPSFEDDITLQKKKKVRIYNILFDYETLLENDRFISEIIDLPEFQHNMSSAEFHYRLGKYVAQREKILGNSPKSILSVAYQNDLPIYVPSFGDSTIGMNVASRKLYGNKLNIDVSLDVNEVTALLLKTKENKGKSGVVIIGGGSPKNFILQTAPQLEEIFGLKDIGHDYFIQITDARPDTGGLSGATPEEAVTWGKILSESLENTVVCYIDFTIALPILSAYTLKDNFSRRIKGLYHQREEALKRLEKALKKSLPINKDQV